MSIDRAINIQIQDKHLGGLNPIACGYEDCEPCHSFGPSIRFFWCIHYVRSGCGTYRINEKEYRVSAGQIFIIPPYIETYYIADEKNPWHYTWICFLTDEPIPNLLNSPVLSIDEAEIVFSKMLKCTDFHNGRSEYLAGCLWELWSILQENSTETKSERTIDKALSIIHSEYYRGITTTEVAGRLGLNRSYFSAMFTKETGTPPIKYINNLRIKKAAELMTEYGISPASAAASIGYSDMSNFSNAFKKHFGISPSKYTLKNRANTEI